MKTASSRHRLLSLACVFGLVALGLMMWSLFDPRPVPVVVAMSVGQAIGTASFVCFVFVVARDLRGGIDAKLHEEDAPVPRADGATPKSE